MSVDFKSKKDGGLLMTGLEDKKLGPSVLLCLSRTVFSIIFTRNSFAIKSSPLHTKSYTKLINFSISGIVKSGDVKSLTTRTNKENASLAVLCLRSLFCRLKKTYRKISFSVSSHGLIKVRNVNRNASPNASMKTNGQIQISP